MKHMTRYNLITQNYNMVFHNLTYTSLTEKNLLPMMD